MPKGGTKRRASEAFPYARKKSSVSGWKPPSESLPVAMPPPTKDKPSVTRSRSTASDKSAKSGSSASMSPPSLRRASTLTIQDDSGDSAELPRRASSKGRSPPKPALSRKESSVVSEHGIVTALEKLPSGSIIGESFTESSVRKLPSLSKSLSKKGSVSLGSKASSKVSKKSSLVSEMSKAVEVLRKGSSVAGAASEPENEEPVTDAPAAGPASALDVPLPPGGLVEVAISFDTTGSMYRCLVEVRAKIQDLIQRLQADIPGIRTAIIAHGDYCDVDKYIIKWIDFGASLPETIDFVNNAESTYGGDGPECYELVLKRARESLSWTPGSQRVLVVIGDDQPHPVGYIYGGIRYDIDWMAESRELKKMGVTAYGVQAGKDPGCIKFMDELANITGGKRLTLNNFANIFDILMMICYREGNPDMMPVYEDEVRGRGGMAKDMADLLITFGADKADVARPKKIATAKRAPAKPKAAKAKALPKVTAKAKKVKGSKAPPAKLTKGVTAKKASVKKASKKRTLQKKRKFLLRESIPDSKLEQGLLKCLKWTPWQLGISETSPRGGARKKFTQCHHYVGYRAREIFNNESKVPAIYEVAVQLPKGNKKYTMYFKRSFGYNTRGVWDADMFRSVKAEVRRVLLLGCNIYIRRGVLKTKKDQDKKLAEVNTYIRKHIDYAWRKKPRKIVRRKMLLSNEKL